MNGSELITAIITATTSLFGLMGIFLGIVLGKSSYAEIKDKLKDDLAAVFWTGIIVISIAIIWFIGSHFGFTRIITDIVWIVTAVAFVAYLISVYNLLRQMFKCF